MLVIEQPWDYTGKTQQVPWDRFKEKALDVPMKP